MRNSIGQTEMERLRCMISFLDKERSLLMPAQMVIPEELYWILIHGKKTKGSNYQ
jgi:hypothetical protein